MRGNGDTEATGYIEFPDKVERRHDRTGMETSKHIT